MEPQIVPPAVEGAAAFYERHQEWPALVAESVARYIRDSKPEFTRAAFLGCATGVNDVLPFARLTREGRILAGDIEPAFLGRLDERVRAEGLSHVSTRRVDILQDLATLGSYDLVSLFFVIHRIAEWRKVAAELPRTIAPGGVFFTSEFVGPEGVIYLSNENGGSGRDPVSRLIRRYFELAAERFDPHLKSTRIGPFLEALAPHLIPDGCRDFSWPQSLTVEEMYRKIEGGAYAPYFNIRAPRVLERLRSEFSKEWSERRDMTENIRVYRFRRV